MIHFTKHALEKFGLLERHGVHIERTLVEQCVAAPYQSDTETHTPLVILEGEFDDTRNLVVVCRNDDGEVVSVVTFYPVKKK